MKPAFMSAVDAARNGNPLSFARVRAICVLPVPGGPYNKAPLGSGNPCLRNASECCSDSHTPFNASSVSFARIKVSHRAFGSTASLPDFV